MFLGPRLVADDGEDFIQEQSWRQWKGHKELGVHGTLVTEANPRGWSFLWNPWVSSACGTSEKILSPPLFPATEALLQKPRSFYFFWRISIGKAGGRVSYSCQMFLLSLYVSRCCTQAALRYSWQELTQIKLCTTLLDGEEFQLWVLFWVFFRSIMCSNCIAWNDLEIICVTVRPFGVYFHEPQWRPHAAAMFVLNLCFTVTKPSSSAFASEFYLLLKRGILYIIHITLVSTTCEVLDKCIIRKQSLLWRVYKPGRKKKMKFRGKEV